MTVGDNWFAIWVMGEHNAVAISYVNEQVSEALVESPEPAGSRNLMSRSPVGTAWDL